MECYTTESFLESKLANMHDRLMSCGASKYKLHELKQHLMTQRSLTSFALKLHEQDQCIDVIAKRIVTHVQVEADRVSQAEKLVRSYLSCFADATWSLAEQH